MVRPICSIDERELEEALSPPPPYFSGIAMPSRPASSRAREHADQVALDLVGAAAEGQDQQAAVEGLEWPLSTSLGRAALQVAARPQTSISSRKDSR